MGLGPAGPELVTAAALDAIGVERPRFVRTGRHPAAEVVAGAVSFDDVYERAATFDDVYTTIVERLVGEARANGEVLYAVPGSPAVAERTVELLAGDARVDVEVVPALSFCDLTWTTLGIDPVARGVSLIDGRRFADEILGRRGPFLVGQCDQAHVLSDVKLAVDYGPIVTVLQRLGLPDQAVFEVAWDELDRMVEPDHLTSLYLPELERSGVAVERFEALARRLRAECPWDREQTHRSLRPFVLEEAAEVAEAIDALGDDPDPTAMEALAGELGDLLFQVVIHCTLATETGSFDLATVTAGIDAKLRRRHPHVFEDVVAETPADATEIWRRVKAEERGD